MKTDSGLDIEILATLIFEVELVGFE